MRGMSVFGILFLGGNTDYSPLRLSGCL
jgi:hypothetical protein